MTDQIKKFRLLLKDELSNASSHSIKKLFIESIRGNNYNFTEIKLLKAFSLLAIPMVIEMLMESLFAIVDIFFVSKLGSDAVAVVGLTESIMTIIYSIAFGLCMATMAVISRRTGEGDREGANHAGFQAIITGIIGSAAITLPCILFPESILSLMGASDSAIALHSGYTKILLGFNIVVFMLFIINAVFRGAGDAAITLRILIFSNLLNIVLCPLFIFGIGIIPAFGTEGAAVATVISRSAAVGLQIYFLFSGRNRIVLSLSRLRVDFQIVGEIFKISIGAIGQNLIAMSSWILLMRFVSDFGSAVTAGYTIALRVLFFVLQPTGGISHSAAALVGQNLGAGRPERASNAVLVACVANFVALSIASVLMYVFSENLVTLFIGDAQAIAHGSFSLKIVSLGLVFYGWSMVFLNSINGAGDTSTPTKLNILIFWIIELPLAYVLAFHTGLHDGGVYWAIFISETILTILAGLTFARGKWKTIRV
jgi:putative MATE family efflux protein